MKDKYRSDDWIVGSGDIVVGTVDTLELVGSCDDFGVNAIVSLVVVFQRTADLPLKSLICEFKSLTFDLWCCVNKMVWYLWYLWCCYIN